MNPASKKSRSGGREAPPSAKEVDTRNKQTPGTDIQPEDAGTPESGNTGRGTAAEGAMKQTSKTGAERGSKR
jgi:hypothetical protein